MFHFKCMHFNLQRVSDFFGWAENRLFRDYKQYTPLKINEEIHNKRILKLDFIWIFICEEEIVNDKHWIESKSYFAQQVNWD